MTKRLTNDGTSARYSDAPVLADPDLVPADPGGGEDAGEGGGEGEGGEGDPSLTGVLQGDPDDVGGVSG